MTESNILALPAGVNDCEILIDGEVNGQPAILSTKIADRFNKKHFHILRDIDQLQSILPASFVAANFGKTYYELQIGNGATRKSCAFLLTRDAFSLLVMGLTGKAAIIWKLRYIEAFNALERAALENQAELAREAGYLEGRQEALCLPVMEAERKQGYLEGLKEGKKLAEKNDRLKVLEKMAGYVQKGLNYTEIGKILGLSKVAVGKRIAAARKKGFWPLREKTCQINLPGVM